MSRLDAALARAQQLSGTSYCPDCCQRKPYAAMRPSNRCCKACWAQQMRIYYYRRSGLAVAWRRAAPAPPTAKEIDQRIDMLSDGYSDFLNDTELKRFYDLYGRSRDAALVFLEQIADRVGPVFICRCGIARREGSRACRGCGQKRAA